MKGYDLNLLQPVTVNITKNGLNPKIVYIYVGLITLQFYLVPLASFVYGTDLNRYATYMHFYAMSSYTIIVLGGIVLHTNGIVLFRDHFTLSIIALSCFLRSAFQGDYELIYRIYMNFLGIVLLVYIIKNRKKINLPSLKSVIVGFLWTAGTVLILVFLYATLDSVHGSLPSDLLTYIINRLVFQLSFVAVIEEVVFRGLIFGFLVMSGCKENTAFFVQAVLFWGFHYMDIANPVLFFVIVPIFTLSVTLIIKKYKMLYLSIIIHLFVNVFLGVLVSVL